MNFTQTSVGGSISEPETRILRHLLDLLRHLDMPSSDARLPRVYPILERVGIQAEWQEGFAQARAAYERAQRVSNIRIEDPDVVRTSEDQDPTWIRPREAFDLWAYGGVIHHDYRKEQRWARLGLAQGPVRMMAQEYGFMLVEQGDYLVRLLAQGIEADVDTLE